MSRLTTFLQGFVPYVYTKYPFWPQSAPQFLSFYAATLYFPLIMMAQLFLPTFIYLLTTCIRFSRKKGRKGSRLEVVIIFLFALFTNISYFHYEKAKDKEENIELFENKRRLRKSLSLPDIKFVDYKKRNEPEFSMEQSHILYIIFTFSVCPIFLTDIIVQMIRNWSLSPITYVLGLVYLCNLLLWLDFIRERKTKNNPTPRPPWLTWLFAYAENCLSVFDFVVTCFR